MYVIIMVLLLVIAADKQFGVNGQSTTSGMMPNSLEQRYEYLERFLHIVQDNCISQGKFMAYKLDTDAIIVSLQSRIEDLESMIQVSGPPGPKGDKGEKGAPGTKGDKGEEGIEGVAGLPGMKGDTGDTGIPGAHGLTGEKGEPGVKGDIGEEGIEGLAGLSGMKGDKGDTGPPGPTGSTGATGRCVCSTNPIGPSGYIP